MGVMECGMGISIAVGRQCGNQKMLFCFCAEFALVSQVL